MLVVKNVEAFVVVAEGRSFTAAGNTLHLTQSAVSRRVLDLERQIGVTLFDRSCRGVDLTPDGNLLLPVLRRLLRHVEQVQGAVEAVRGGARTQPSAATTPTYPTQRVHKP